jgi:hypothetical protein
VFAVPKSIPIAFENLLNNLEKIAIYPQSPSIFGLDFLFIPSDL